MESIDCTTIEFWEGMSAFFIGAIALVIYTNYNVQRGEMQDFDRYWYHYPANEVFVPFIGVQFLAMMVLLLIPQTVSFSFVVLVEIVLLPSYLFHFWLCYHKENCFTPPELTDFIAPLTVYRHWKVFLIYIVPCLLLSAVYIGWLSSSFMLMGYLIPTSIVALWLTLRLWRRVRSEWCAVWRLPVERASTYLLRNEECFKVHISTHVFNCRYYIGMGEPRMYLWRKLVYFRLFDNAVDAAGHKLLLEQLEKESIEMLICKQNPTGKDKTDIIRKQ